MSGGFDNDSDVSIPRPRRRIGIALTGAAVLAVLIAALLLTRDESRSVPARSAQIATGTRDESTTEPARWAQIAELQQLLRASCASFNGKNCRGEGPEFNDAQAAAVCPIYDLDPRDPPEECLALVSSDEVGHAGVITTYTTYWILDGRSIPDGVASGCCVGWGDFTWSNERPAP